MRRDEAFWAAASLKGGAAEVPTALTERYPTIQALLLAGMDKPPRAGPETGPEVSAEASSSVAGLAELSAAEAERGAARLGASDSAPDVVGALVGACKAPDIALLCGSMLREAIRDQAVAGRMMACPERYLWPFFESKPGAMVGGFLDDTNFDVASDAFATIRDLLTRHRVR